MKVGVANSTVMEARSELRLQQRRQLLQLDLSSSSSSWWLAQCNREVRHLARTCAPVVAAMRAAAVEEYSKSERVAEGTSSEATSDITKIKSYKNNCTKININSA